MNAPAPYFEPRQFRCKRGHEWDGHMPQWVTVKIWVAHMKTLRCPECGIGSRGVFLVTEPPAGQARQAPDASDPARSHPP